MVTNNLKKIWSAGMSTSSTPSVQLTNIDGTSYSTPVTYVIPTKYSTSPSGSNRFYIAVGSGNTEPTLNDVSLESEITTLTNIGGVTDNAEYGITYNATLTNTTVNDVIIKEYGIYVYSDAWKMLTRTVLDNPITLESGEIATIAINLGF